mgnify:CR=1 FL=1
MMEVGSKHLIRAITGNDAVKKHLGDLGFTEGTEVTIIASVDGNLVLGVHQSRVAVNRDLAVRILV